MDEDKVTLAQALAAIKETLREFEGEDDDGLHCTSCGGAGRIHSRVCRLLPLIDMLAALRESRGPR